MKKKIVIVGGGFTGVIAATFLSNHYDVSLYDGKEKLGGVLSDINYNNYSFLRGCQYLDVNSNWFNELKLTLKDDLELFDFTYHSYTEYKNENSISSNQFECPVFKNIKLKNYSDQSTKISLSDRFNLYDEDIAFYLKSLIKKLNVNADKIIFKNAINFQLDRITSLEQVNEITKLKKINSFDTIYALDSKKLKIQHKTALPIRGYDIIFKKLTKFLNTKGVKIFCGKKIIPSWKNQQLDLIYNKEKIHSDYIIWTANPVALLNYYFKEPLESKSIKIRQLDFNYKEDIFQNIYIQVFSTKTSIFRIFLYKFDGLQKISVECANDFNENIEKIQKKLNEILISFNINFNPENIKICNESKYLRYDLCTLKDYKLISKFRDLTKKSNLICSEWDTYGRENKINNLFQVLKDKKII
jgi:hypothetical protein